MSKHSTIIIPLIIYQEEQNNIHPHLTNAGGIGTTTKLLWTQCLLTNKQTATKLKLKCGWALRRLSQ